MKFIIIFFALAVGTLSQPTIPIPATVNFTEFITGIYNNYELGIPTQIIQCFNETTSYYFLQLMVYYSGIAEAISNGETGTYVGELYLLVNYIAALSKPIACANQTSNFETLLKYLNITSQQELEMRIGLYIQAYPNEFIANSESLYQAFNNGKYLSAGTLFAELLPVMINNCSNSIDPYCGARGFFNGLFLGLNLEAPVNSFFCYNESNAELLMSFFETWGETIGDLVDDSEQTVENATQEFFQGEGNQIWYSIPPPVIKCLYDSSDNTRLEKALGFSPFFAYSTILQEELGPYINASVNDYVHLMRNMSQLAINQANNPANGFIDAGIYYGYLCNGIFQVNHTNSMEIGIDIL